jgi:hypothetical protein
MHQTFSRVDATGNTSIEPTALEASLASIPVGELTKREKIRTGMDAGRGKTGARFVSYTVESVGTASVPEYCQ